MLTISPEKVCYIVVKAREFDVKEAPNFLDTGDNPSDDRDLEILEDYADDPTYEELLGAITNLNRDELLDLMALTWIGRGDFSRDQWDEARENAAGIPGPRLAGYLVGTPLLGDYLEEGLSAFDLSCGDVEKEHL